MKFTSFTESKKFYYRQMEFPQSLIQLIIIYDIIFLSLLINFVLSNSADSDEMQHYVAFHLGFLYLSKYLFTGTHAERRGLVEH